MFGHKYGCCDHEMLMAAGNKLENDEHCGPDGKVTIDLESGELRVHDGVTPGGLWKVEGVLTASTSMFSTINNTRYKTICFKRGYSKDVIKYVGSAGELIINKEAHELIICDGSTPGGYFKMIGVLRTLGDGE